MAKKFVRQARNRPKGVLGVRGDLSKVIQDSTTAFRPLYLSQPFTRIEKA